MTLKQFRNLSRGNLIINKDSGVAFIVTSDRNYWSGSSDEEKPLNNEDVITIVPYKDSIAQTIVGNMADLFYKG